MKNILFIALMLICLASKSQDIITMKTGEEVKAKVLEVGLSEVKYKKFDVQESPIYTVSKSDVFMIKYHDGTKDVFNSTTENKVKNETQIYIVKSKPRLSDSMLMNHGFIDITEIDFSVLKGNHSLGVHTMAGYQFNPVFILGIGSGIDIYGDGLFTFPMLPVFVDMRTSFNKTTIAPYFDLEAGYSFPIGLNNQAFEDGDNSGISSTSITTTTPKHLADRNSGGLLLNPSFGIKFCVSPNNAVSFSLGYKLQENSYSNTEINGNTITSTPSYIVRKYQQLFSFVNFKFGVTF